MFPSLTIPDELVDWPEWLERQLMGLQLRELIEELPILTGVGDDESATLGDVLGNQTQMVYEQGLSVLPQSQLSKLIKSPHLLLELQERVLEYGGGYWDAVPIVDEQAELEQAQRDLIFKAMVNDDMTCTVTSDEAEKLPLAAEQPKKSNQRKIIAAVLVTSFLIGALLRFNRPASTGGWGFNQPELLTADVDANTYLKTLAKAAEQWSNKRPDTRESLAKRLQQFRNGCQILIDAEHPQLSETDRDWLIERCQVWQGKIDNQLVALQAGGNSVSEVRQATNEIIEKLVVALRDHEVTS